MSQVSEIDKKALLAQLDIFAINHACCNASKEEAMRQEAAQAEMERLKRQGQHRRAMILEIDRLQAIFSRFGEQDPRVQQCLQSMMPMIISLAMRMNRMDFLQPPTLPPSARMTLRQTVEMGVRVFREIIDLADPGDVAVLASLFQRVGNLEIAEQLWKSAVQLQQKKTEIDDVAVVRHTIRLAYIYKLQEKWPLAQPPLEQALNVMRRLKGDEDIETIRVAQMLMDIYNSLERWDEVLTIRHWLVTWAAKSQAGDNLVVLEPILISLSAYMGLNQWREAAEKGKEALELMRKVLPPNDPLAVLWTSSIMKLEQRAASLSNSQSSNSQKIYSPLDAPRQVRLVRLKRGTFTGDIQASLMTCSLETAPSYEALSYVWGSMVNSRKLEINKVSALDITHNLWDALKHLVPRGRTRTLLIDAICINQADLIERAEQVRLMTDIYAKARRTVVWLGPAEEESEIAMKTLRYMERHSSPSTILEQLLSTENARVLNALHGVLVKREYWSRLWIIQEVNCAKNVTVQCGNSEVGFAIMKDFAMLLKIAGFQRKDFASLRKFDYVFHKFASIGPMRICSGETDDEKRTESSLLELLRSHMTARCSDPRDRVYGFVGISGLSASSHTTLPIDYKAPIGTVYQRAARTIIEETSCLDILCSVAEPGVDLDNPYRIRQPFLPSWVPDWNTARRNDRLAVSAPRFDACPNSKADVSFSADGAVLTAQGIMLGYLQPTAPPLTIEAFKDGREGIRTLLSWRLMAQLAIGASPFGSSGILLPEFYSLLIYAQPAFRDFDKSAAVWWAEWQRSLMAHKGVDDFKISEAQQAYLECVFNACRNRRFFLMRIESETSNAIQNPSSVLKIGTGSDAVAEGDLVCVLLGCRFPVVLRPKHGYYTLVGEAYIPHYGDGLALEELAAGKRQLTKFEIH